MHACFLLPAIFIHSSKLVIHLPTLTQIFEAYGLGKEVVDTAFVGSVSRIGGMSIADIQRETEAFWAKGFPDKVRGEVAGGSAGWLASAV